MIDYDPHDWSSHLLDMKGSMVREIFARVALCVAWSMVVVLIDRYLFDVGIPPQVHALLGTALSLLLVFRTNSSYDRFWEGRRMWGNMINESRNMGRCAATYLNQVPDLQRRLLEWTIAFAYAAMHRLRGQRQLGEASKFFPLEEQQRVLAADHLPLQISLEISRTLREARDRGAIGDYQLVNIDQNTQLLIDYIGACERIEKTPLPFAYMVHLRRGLLLYCFTLPFALVNAFDGPVKPKITSLVSLTPWEVLANFDWPTVLLTFLVAYLFFGIEEIGVEIEGPFGDDENDLPLERFCAGIESDLLDCLPSALPEQPGQ